MCSENIQQFTEEHQYGSAISIKLVCNFIEITLQHGCSPVNIMSLHHLYMGQTFTFKNFEELYSELYQTSKMEFFFKIRYFCKKLNLRCLIGIYPLTHLFPMHPSSTPWVFLMFSGGRERVHWERKS